MGRTRKRQLPLTLGIISALSVSACFAILDFGSYDLTSNPGTSPPLDGGSSEPVVIVEDAELPDVGVADFALDPLATPTLRLPVGRTINVPVRITRGASFTGSVTLSISNVDASLEDGGVTTSPPSWLTTTTSSIPSNESMGSVAFTATSTAPLLATATLTLVAQSASVVHSGSVVVTIVGLPGTVDTTFGTDGVSVIPLTGGGAASFVTIDTAGDIVVVGEESAAAASSQGVVARFHAGGKPDSTFGTNGSGFARVSGRSVWARVEPDRSMEVAGLLFVTNESSYSISNTTMTRLAADGGIDTTYADSGVASAPSHYSSNALHAAFAAFGDGGVVGAGEVCTPSCFNNLDPKSRLVAFTRSGAPASSFGDGGISDLDAPDGGSMFTKGLFDLPNGKTLLIGEYAPGLGIGGGATTTVDGFGLSTPQQLVVVAGKPSFDCAERQADGKILAVQNSGGTSLIRLNADGTVDPTFLLDGGTGQTSPLLRSLCRIATAPDGSHYVTNNGGILHFSADGRIDMSFGDNGASPVVIGASNVQWYALAVQQTDSYGRIIVGGQYRQNNQNQFAVARYWP